MLKAKELRAQMVFTCISNGKSTSNEGTETFNSKLLAYGMVLLRKLQIPRPQSTLPTRKASGKGWSVLHKDRTTVSGLKLQGSRFKLHVRRNNQPVEWIAHERITFNLLEVFKRLGS